MNDIQEISPIPLNYEAFVGVLGGMFFTSVASLIVLMIRKSKKQRPKFMFGMLILLNFLTLTGQSGPVFGPSELMSKF